MSRSQGRYVRAQRGNAAMAGAGVTWSEFGVSHHEPSLHRPSSGCNPPSQLLHLLRRKYLPFYDQTSSGQPVKTSQSRHDSQPRRSIPDERHSAQPREPFSRLSPHNPEAMRGFIPFRLLCHRRHRCSPLSFVFGGPDGTCDQAREAFGGVAMV